MEQGADGKDEEVSVIINIKGHRLETVGVLFLNQICKKNRVEDEMNIA